VSEGGDVWRGRCVEGRDVEGEAYGGGGCGGEGVWRGRCVEGEVSEGGGV